jgi:pyrroline-5-carboxylate reductase
VIWLVEKTVGFVGGGRIARIILGGLKRAGRFPAQVVVSDREAGVLKKLKAEFPEVRISPGDNNPPSGQEIVFLALHPPAISGVLAEIQLNLRAEAVLVSLAPKFTIEKLTEGLGGFRRIVRMIPNAPSVMNRGYNPLTFSPVLTKTEKEALKAMLSILGECPEVPEENLEAYAVLTAMGPTYLWFQFAELQKLGNRMGLTVGAAAEGLFKMVVGTAETMFRSGLSPEEVMDLIPVKPLEDAEEEVKIIYQTRLMELYQKLRPAKN